MASAFGHGIAAVAIGKLSPVKQADRKFWLLGIACSILPDADVLGFHFGVPYDSFFGYRGITHSFFFAFILGAVVVRIFYRDNPFLTKTGIVLLAYFFLCTASHGILDTMTSGGRRVALLDNTRYFLPWRPIKVSPLSVTRFFSERGWMVLKSELIWIGIPCFLAFTVTSLFRKKEIKS